MLVLSFKIIIHISYCRHDLYPYLIMIQSPVVI